MILGVSENSIQLTKRSFRQVHCRSYQTRLRRRQQGNRVRISSPNFRASIKDQYLRSVWAKKNNSSFSSSHSRKWRSADTELEAQRAQLNAAPAAPEMRSEKMDWRDKL
jgi:hypothetical protein